MVAFIIALVMCLGALTGLILVTPSVFYSWRIAPLYYNLARIALPFITLGYFGPQLFGIAFPGRNGWVSLVFLAGLALVMIAIVVYLYREPGESQRKSSTNAAFHADLEESSSNLLLRTALPQDLLGAGTIFALAFQQSFDLDFGPDRQRNARLISELLGIKACEVEVAVVPETGQVVGAMWLDLGDKSVPKMTFGRSWPILRRYLSWLHALYFSLYAMPSIMSRRGTSEEGYIQWLGVDPDWQGHHIGRALVERAIALSRERGKRTLALHTERSNERARKLYQRTGFKEGGTVRFSPRVHYVKHLQA